MYFIKRWLQNKKLNYLTQSDNAVQTLVREWQEFCSRNQYLIYRDKSRFLSMAEQAKISSKTAWYFFFDSTRKKQLKSNMRTIQSYENEIHQYNSAFIAERKIKYAALFGNGKRILDDAQQTAVLTDDTHNLIVAGAGSGKTEVLITRIAYLIKRNVEPIKPERILALAFQNKAANEIKERLKRRYHINIEIRTFHSLGRKIIHDAAVQGNTAPPVLNPECSEDWKFQKYMQSLFDYEIRENSRFRSSIIHFMKKYDDDEQVKSETDFHEKEEYYRYRLNLDYTALDGTRTKSEAEREITNFFLMNKLNGRSVRILYEAPAHWMEYQNQSGEMITPKPDFFFPEFDLYLEHWAINKYKKVPKWFQGDDPSKEYIESMNLKKEKFKENNKDLIETSHADYENGTLSQALSERFLAALALKFPNKRLGFQVKSYTELIESVWESAKSIRQLPMNISRFIVIAKTNRIYANEIEDRLKNESWSPRQLAFGRVACHLYAKYQDEMSKGNFIDFSDMINTATDFLHNNSYLYRGQYDHILIDEYQDISSQRFELIRELMKKNANCKLFCIGDDWQSIMGFAGSNLSYFINFKDYFPNPAIIELSRNYRSIKSIVDAGACIIANNKNGQLKKNTIANTQATNRIFVYSSLHKKNCLAQYYDQVAEHCIKLIRNYHEEKAYRYDEFIILLRIANNPRLRNSISAYAREQQVPISEKADRPNSVRIMSVHKSKGLEARVVFVLNVDAGLYGFPCEMENPKIFYPAIRNNDGLRKEEERRLFYVAVNRAKEEVILYTQKETESEFITEIKDFVQREELT